MQNLIHSHDTNLESHISDSKSILEWKQMMLTRVDGLSHFAYSPNEQGHIDDLGANYRNVSNISGDREASSEKQF